MGGFHEEAEGGCMEQGPALALHPQCKWDVISVQIKGRNELCWEKEDS